MLFAVLKRRRRKKKEFTAPPYGEVPRNPNQKNSIIFPLLITMDFWDTNKKFHNKKYFKKLNDIAINGDVCTDFTL